MAHRQRGPAVVELQAHPRELPHRGPEGRDRLVDGVGDQERQHTAVVCNQQQEGRQDHAVCVCVCVCVGIPSILGPYHDRGWL